MLVKIVSVLLLLLTASGGLCFSGDGDGSIDNPYQIATYQHLEEVNNDLTAHYILASDIDLSQIIYETAVIAPNIGTAERFAGTLDGNGYTIYNLTINAPTGGYLGLIGRIDTGGEVKNLALEDCDISADGQIDNYFGTLAGYQRGVINCCYATGNIDVGGNRVGGLVGYNYSGTVTNSYAAVNVSADGGEVGGLVGRNRYAKIIRCYSNGTVWSGAGFFGGLVGTKTDGEGYEDTGNFWDMNSSANSDSAMGTGKEISQMQLQSTFTDAGWDFAGETINGSSNIWYMQPNGYPRLNGVGGGSGDIEVLGMVISQRRRIGQTLFEYDLRVKIENSGDAINSADIRLLGYPANIEIIGSDLVSFGATSAGEQKLSGSEEFITLRVDKTNSTDPNKITWYFQSNLEFGIADAQIITSNFKMSFFGADGLGIAEFLEIAESWLSYGIADANSDGIVNYQDIAAISTNANTQGAAK